MDKAWKRNEREEAKAFGVERNARMGKNAGDTTEHPIFSIEIKYRKTIPKLIGEGLSQAAGYYPDKTPLLVVKERGMRGSIVCMWRKDFIDHFGKCGK